MSSHDPKALGQPGIDGDESRVADRAETRRARMRGDDFDRVEIMGRLRVVERGERTMYERALQERVTQLEEALRRIADGDDGEAFTLAGALERCIDIARAALAAAASGEGG